MRRINLWLCLNMVLAAVVSCDAAAVKNESISVIDTLSIGRHLVKLSSDEFMGRKPFTVG